MIDRIKSFARGIKYYGHNYYCNLCDSTYRDFIAIGLDNEVNRKYRITGSGLRKVVCPGCLSKERERLIFLYLQDVDFFSVPGLVKVLHIAPERSLTKKFLYRSNIEYVCGDKFCDGHRYPSYTRNMDITALDLPNDFFDLVLCNHVLEHVPEDRKGMSELFRVLKPGGNAILQVPISLNLPLTIEDAAVTSPEDRLKHYGQGDHVRVYGQDYTERLRSVGFDVTTVNLFEKHPELSRRMGLNPEELLFLGQKVAT